MQAHLFRSWAGAGRMSPPDITPISPLNAYVYSSQGCFDVHTRALRRWFLFWVRRPPFFLPFFLALPLPFLPSNIASHLSFLFLLFSTCLVVSCQTAKYTAFQDKNGSVVRSPHVSRHARQCPHITSTVLVLYFRSHRCSQIQLRPRPPPTGLPFPPVSTSPPY